MSSCLFHQGGKYHFPRFSLQAVLAGSTIIFLSMSGAAFATVETVPLGTTSTFGVLAGSGITNTGATTINGDVGTYPTTSETGFSTMTITGTNHDGDAVTQIAKTDLTTAYNAASSEGPTSPIVSDLAGQTLYPGVYNSSSSVSLSGTLVLNGNGNSNSVFVLQAGSTLTTSSASQISLTNGAQACNVYWQVGSSATLGTNSNFVGTILALTSITADTGATVAGRLLASNGAVTLDANTVTVPTCASSTTTTSTTTPTTSVTAGPTSGTPISAINTVTVPTTSTGMPWAGWIWWSGVSIVGLAGLVGVSSGIRIGRSK